MFITPKIEQQLTYLKEFIYIGFKEIKNLEVWHDDREDKRYIPPKGTPFEKLKLGDYWEGKNQYYWVKGTVQVPDLKENEKFILHFDLERVNGNQYSSFESLAFVNGHVYQALDSNHQDLYLSSDFKNKEVTFHIACWTGMENPPAEREYRYYVAKEATCGLYNEAIYKTYRYLLIMSEIIKELSDDEPLKYEYMKLLNRSLLQFDFGRETKATITKKCLDILKEIHEFEEKYQGQKKDFRISAIGHTHIDVAWLWQLQHTREKTARSFATVLELMREYPDYQFMHTTPQVYEYVKEDYPELYKEIKKRVKEKRWDPDGSTWLEPDTNIPTGESLTRQFLYGMAFFEKEFHAKQSVLWLPDVFGYSSALPQIMKKFEIDNFMTTKISWNESNRMPHDTFWWKGIDGSTVLTHFITTVDDHVDYHDESKWSYTYNGFVTPHTVLGSYHVYKDKINNNDLLLAYGYGDGGGGPQRETIENIEMLNKLPGMPTVENTQVDDYFDRLHANIKNSQLPLSTWDGELYLEFHRGTYTSQAWIKKANRKLEFALRNLEIRLTNAQMKNQVPYPKEKMLELWHLLLRNQFHDILPGSSIHEVYEDAKEEFKYAFGEVGKLQQMLDEKTGNSEENAVTVYNYNAWPVSQNVEIENEFTGYYTDEKKQKYSSERLDDSNLVNVEVPAFSSKVLHFVKDKTQTPVKKALEKEISEIEDENYFIAWDKKGRLTRIFDKKHQKEVLSGFGNELIVYEDRPIYWNNWEINRDYVEKAYPLKAEKIYLKHSSKMRQEVVFEYSFHHSKIKQSLILHSDTRRIDFKTKVDWQDHLYLLRTQFETTVLSDYATFDIQYGNLRRQTTNNTSWEEAKFETVAHKWADLSQRDYGVALMNDSKYGYSLKGNKLSMSLIKSGTSPDATADQGVHEFTYSLFPHEGDFVAGEVEKEAMVLNNPLMARNDLANEIDGLFTLTSENPVIVDAIKPSEDGKGIILRFHDYTGGNETVTVKPNFSYNKVSETLLSEKVDKANIKDLSFQLKPYEIKTLLFTI